MTESVVVPTWPASRKKAFRGKLCARDPVLAGVRLLMSLMVTFRSCRATEGPAPDWRHRAFELFGA